jgi:hypothetical protein
VSRDCANLADDYCTEQRQRGKTATFSHSIQDRKKYFQTLARLWDTSFMAKRNLRVTRWHSATPAIGVCTACKKEFKTPIAALAKAKDARDNLQQQLDRHTCVLVPESDYWSCEYPGGCGCGCGHVPGRCEDCHHITGIINLRDQQLISA